MEKELRDIKKRWESTPSISKRLKETGRLDEKDAVKLTGRPARAAGKPHDSRKYSNLPYEKLSYNIPVTEGSNCFARVILKLEDLLQSLDLIDQAIENLPKGDVKEQVMVNGSGTAMVREPEANGELIVFVKQEEGHVASLKIRNSSALHLPFLAGCLEGTELTDLPLVLSSFDLDLSGMEK
jgi:ech hydrogenase subunit E